MSNAVLVIGRSGTGKTTSIETLPPKETFYIGCTKKDLPFKGAKTKYEAFNTKDNPKGNHLITDKSGILVGVLNYINENRPDIKYIVLDDFIYSMSNEFVRRGKEKGFQMYNDIGVDAGMILMQICNNMRDDINIVVFNHSDEYTDVSGIKMEKFKTIGKLVDDKVNPEGMFATVLYTDVSKGEKGMEYGFLTQNTGLNTGKSPKGMFDKEKIPNDMKLVFDTMDKYFFE